MRKFIARYSLLVARLKQYLFWQSEPVPYIKMIWLPKNRTLCTLMIRWLFFKGWLRWKVFKEAHESDGVNSERVVLDKKIENGNHKQVLP